MVTEGELRQVQERKRAQLGLNMTESQSSTVGPEPVTAPCKICGKGIDVSPMQVQFRLRPPNILAHRECIQAENHRRKQEQLEAIKQERQTALDAVRANLPGALGRCGVPKHFLSASFDLCPDLPPKLVETARQWVRDFDGMVYLYGPPGAGKTWLAVAMARAALETGLLSPTACRYIGEREFLDALKANFDSNAPLVSSRKLPSTHPRRVQLLLYDDMGAARQTDWTRGEIATLFEARHASDLPTIITSNVEPNGLIQAVDGRVLSRIAEYRMMLEFPKRDLRVFGKLNRSVLDPDNEMC